MMSNKKFSPGPDLADLCKIQKRLNPEFSEPVSDRAMASVAENMTERQAQAFRMRLLSVIEQEEESPIWQNRLERIDSDEYEGSKRIAATDAEFGAAPVSLAKTVQRVLTSPAERLVFEEDEMDPENKNLSGIIIDPSKITDTLLRNLGLEEYLPRKGAHADEKIGCYAQAVPEIKEMLASLRPLETGQGKSLRRVGRFRLMRIGSGRYEGYVFGTQAEDGHAHFFRTDLRGAYRRINHIRMGYEEEIAEINKILHEIKEISREISTGWSEIKGSEKLKEYRTRLLSIVDGMKHVRDKYKTGIREVIEESADFKTLRTLKEKIGVDASGNPTVKRPAKTIEVYNPGAINAKFTRVGRYVKRRHAHSSEIMAELQRDQLKLRDLIASHEMPFDKFYKFVGNMHSEFALLHESNPLTPEVKKKIIRNLIILRDGIRPSRSQSSGSNIIMQPYAGFGFRMAGYIDETIAELEKPEVNREAAANDFLKIYLVSKVHHLFHELQEFYDEFLSSSCSLNYGRMYFLISRIIREFRCKTLDEKVNGHSLSAPEFNKIFGELFHLLNALLVRIKAGQRIGEEGLIDAHKKLRNEMRSLIHDFRFDELMTVAL